MISMSSRPCLNLFLALDVAISLENLEPVMSEAEPHLHRWSVVP